MKLLAMRSMAWFLGFGFTAGAPWAAHAQSTLRAGTEFRISEFTIGDQRLPAAAAALDGTVLVVWESQFQDGDSFGVFGRFLGPTGAPLGPEFQINQATGSDQKQPSVTVDLAGRFTVAWTGQDVSGGGVFARQFTASGPLGPEFQVNAYTTGDQFLPRVSAGPGGIGVVWQSDGQDGSLGGVYGRILSHGGVPASDEFRLSTDTAGGQIQPQVAALDNGRYAMAWGLGDFVGMSGLYSRLFDAEGVPLSPDRTLISGGRVDHLSISALPGGAFGVGWWSAFTWSGKDATISTDFGVRVRIHDAQGVPTTAVGAGGAGTGSIARWQGAVGPNLAGGMLVAYTSTPNALPCGVTPHWPPPNPCTANGAEDGSGSGIFARPIGLPGLPDRVLVNTTTAGEQTRPAVGADPVGNSVVAWQSSDGAGLGVFAQRFGGFYPVAVAVDPAGNGVLDPGVDEPVVPSWRNVNGAAQTFGGATFGFIGPAGPSYAVADPVASYGLVANGAAGTASGDPYQVRVTLDGPRPALHMDSYLGEALTPAPFSLYWPWRLHVGGSFADVSAASVFYRHIEALLHNGITSGCGSGSYCASASTTRAQMSVFALLAREGAAYLPPACVTPVFADVPATSPFCRWVEELARRGVTSGCSGPNFCPDAPVTREQMAVFVLRTLDPALDPPACTTPVFADVPATSPFCRWIEELARRGVVGGCGPQRYCAQDAVTREQMAVFLSATFGLRLY